MKKIFLLLACIALIYTAVIVSCSDNPEINSNDATIESLAITTESRKGEVPRDRLFYTFGNKGKLSTNQLIEVYKKDISTAVPDYSTNLKNMWLTVLNPRVYNEGTEEQKLFCINEQLGLDNNLAHFTSFYNLLSTSKLIDKIEKERIAQTYYDKNSKAIADVQWSNPKDGKNKEMELAYAKRTFQNLLNTQK